MSGFDRIALIGWGAIGTVVARLLAERGSSSRIVAVGVRDAVRARDLPQGAKLMTDPAHLAATGATLVVEAAGRGSVRPWGQAALSAGMDFAVSSTSAFVDDHLLSDLLAMAEGNAAQILIPPGALGGIDALASAARLGVDSVTHTVTKPASAWAGTEAETLCPLHSLAAPVTFFEGSARQAADRFPKNANVAVITSLAAMGLEKTRIALVADPVARFNTHRIQAKGAFGTMDMQIENHPLPENPKSSAMTALNLVRMIENRSAPLSL